jgi:hypothetical protein
VLTPVRPRKRLPWPLTKELVGRLIALAKCVWRKEFTRMSEVTELQKKSDFVRRGLQSTQGSTDVIGHHKVGGRCVFVNTGGESNSRSSAGDRNTSCVIGGPGKRWYWVEKPLYSDYLYN